MIQNQKENEMQTSDKTIRQAFDGHVKTATIEAGSSAKCIVVIDGKECVVDLEIRDAIPIEGCMHDPLKQRGTVICKQCEEIEVWGHQILLHWPPKVGETPHGTRMTLEDLYRLFLKRMKEDNQFQSPLP